MRRFLLLLLWASAGLAGETRYEIDLAQAAAHTLPVTVDADCHSADCDFQMPVWNATYQIRDFAQFVSLFQATRASGEPLPHRMVTPSRWRVKASPGERVRVRYQYFADSPGPFGCSASNRHVFLNFAQVLLYPADGLREPMSVRFQNKPPAWKVALELPERDGAFRARHYDELADAPSELSAFAETAFSLAGKRVRLVVDGEREDYDLARLEDTARKVAFTAAEIMQDVPFPAYTFIYHFRPDAGGGMEHANSTAIEAKTGCRECSLASVTAHEFFHLWNVKRIRPHSLEPVDYTRENITPSLWFSEGVTATYGTYILLQAGLEDRAAFLKRLEGDITRYERHPARLMQSAEESSIAAWLERYPYYDRPARSVSYYLKGELAGYLLDLTIRHSSANHRSLDDVMRRLNANYAQKGKYFEDTEAIERVASEAAGCNLKEFFDSVIRGTAPMEWGRYRGWAGYRLVSGVTKTPTLGIDTSLATGGRQVVAAVEPGGSAEKAELRPGDRILSFNGRRVDGNPDEALEALALQPGARVSVEVSRAGRTRTLQAVPDFVERSFYRIEEDPHGDAAALAIRAAWLRAPEGATKP